MDRSLRRHFDVPPPPLRPGFVRRFEQRRRHERLAARRWWLHLYWAAFLVMSAGIVASSDWSPLAAWLPVLGGAWMAVLIASPVLALIALPRSGLFSPFDDPAAQQPEKAP